MSEQIITFVKDWGGWIISVSMLIIAVISYLHSRRIPKLVCILDRPISLISIRKEVRDQIEVLYKGRKIDNLVLSIIKVRNDGNVPITKKHVAEPLKFIFDEKTEIIDYSVVSTIPEEINVDLKRVNSSVVCSFDLLNPKDEITLQIVFTGSSERPKVKGRIVGIRKIDVWPEEMVRKSSRVGYMYAIIGFSMILLAALFWVTSPATSPMDKAPVIIFGIYGFLFVVMGIVALKNPRVGERIMSRW